MSLPSSAPSARPQALALASLLGLVAALAKPALAQLDAVAGTADRTPARLVRVAIDGPEAWQTLVELDLDTLCRGPVHAADAEEGGIFQDVIADDADLDALAARGIDTTILVPDLVEHYQSRLASPEELAASAPPSLGASLSPPFGQGSMGGFYTWTEVVSVIDQLIAAYPGITTDKVSIATTHEGRDVWMFKVSDNPDVDENEPEVRMDSLHHAREPESMQVMIWFLSFLLEGYGSDPLATYLVDEREIWFIPVVNPDGYVYNESIAPGGGGLWRKNRRVNGGGSFGVDLNRNYPFNWGFDNIGSSPTSTSDTYRGPSAASEPETVAMVNLMATRDFATAISAHCSGNIWLTPWGYDGDAPLANQADYDEIGGAAAPPGWPIGPGEFLLNYTANGVTNDEDQGTHGIMSWTPEIGSSADGFWPSTARIIPLAEETLPGLQATALAAGAFLRILSVSETEEGDGDGLYEPGESLAFRFDLRNSGLAATGTSVDLSLSTTSPDATITTGNVALGVLASFTGTDNNANPLRFSIDAGTPGGTAIDYLLTVSAEGYDQTISGTIVTGTPRPFVFDDAETDLGWTLGIPSDTASTGIWTRDDPIATTSGGNQVQPADDHTPGAGVNAYMTGNGSSSAGGDDVDDGVTTLISPPFDLSGVGTTILSYARWYALFSEIDDTLEVSISNDDGQSWTPLESVGAGQNSWQTPQFLVDDIIAKTDEMRLRFVASDDPNNSLVEALVDDLDLTIYDDAPRINLYGEQDLGATVRFNTTAAEGSPFIWYLSPFTGNLQIGLIQGPLLLDPGSLFFFFQAVMPAGDLLPVDIPMPADPGAAGVPLYLQAFVLQGGIKYFTNRVTLELQ